MSPNSFSPYTVPYSGVVGTANFVPGAAAHPPAPQDKHAQGAGRLPSIAEEPVTADTSRSKGESMAAGAAGSPPQDAIPARFASAGASAASGGITIVKGGLGDGGFLSSAKVFTSGGLGRMSDQKNEQPKGVGLNNKARSPFGTDGQEDDEGMPSSPTLMTMSAQRHADRALPVIIRELKALKAENQRLRDAYLRLQSTAAGNDMSGQLLAGLQSSNQQLQTQVQNLYMQVGNLQQQAQGFSRQRDRLQAQLTNTELSLEELVDLIVRLEGIVRRIDPDIFVTFPYDVQELLTSIHEEWKYQEYCKCFHPEDDEDSSDSTIIQPQNAVRDQSLSIIIGPSSPNLTVSSAAPGGPSSSGSDNGPSKAANVPATAANSDTAGAPGDIANISNAELLRQLFQDLTVGDTNTVGLGQQTPQRARATENLLEFSSPDTPSSIGTPRTVYSSASEIAQGTGNTQGLQTSHTAQATHTAQAAQTGQNAQDGQNAQAGQNAQSVETTQGMMATNTIDSLGIRGTYEH